MITPVTILPGMDGVVGGAYNVSTNQLFFVEFDGEFHRLNVATHADTLIGTGYQLLEHIALSRDGRHAYVTERGSTAGAGSLLKVDLLNANRVHATVVATGMTAPHQIVLDEDRSQAYVVEFAPAGRLLRIDLTTGTKTSIIGGLQGAVGLAITTARDFAYVSEQTGGRITRIRLADGHREVITTGLTAPFFVNFLGSGESQLITTERDPANHVTIVNIASSPATVTRIANVPFRPSDAIPAGAGEVLVCSDQIISKLQLLPYTSTGTILLGFGYVPFNRIVNGFADTTVDPGYFFQVKDAPFGGSVPVMVNHQGASTAGAHFYVVEVGGVAQTAPFTDYRLNAGTGNFDAITTSPVNGIFFPVRPAGEVWLNQWLGGFIHTDANPPIANGLRNVAVRIFSAANAATEIGHATDAGRHVQIMVDNGWPVASIDQILHNGTPVSTCAMVHVGSTGANDQFQFTITAKDPEKHLLSWSLSAMWGDNQSAGITSQSYTPVPTKEWLGVAGGTVPAPAWHATVPGDLTSINCAHTFYLGAWDRVINGWNYLHFSQYHKSITILP